MAWFRQTKAGEGATVSADFRHALTQQVLRTELIRIKALIGTTVLLGSLIFIVHVFDPNAIQKLWHGRFNPSELFVVLQDEMDVAAGFLRQPADGAAQRVQQMRLARLGDGVHGIEPQSIETIA